MPNTFVLAVVKKVWRAGVLALVLVFLAASHLQAADIQGVRLWRAPDHTRVVFDLSGVTEYKYFALSNPERLVIDLQNSKLLASLQAVDVSGTPIKKLRGASRAGSSYRIVLDLQSKVKPKAFLLAANSQYGERLVIDLYDQHVQQVVKHAADNNGRRDIIIALDAGHGGEDPGALGPRKIREKNVVLAIAKAMQKLFNQRSGYRAVLIRDGDYYVGLQKRRDLARKYKADMFISIHADAFKDKRVSGSSVYTLSQRGASSASARFLANAENNADRIGGVDLSGKDDLLTSVLLDLSMTATLDSSAKAAKNILQAIKPVAALHKNTVEHAAFAVLKAPDIPSILVETGFISNPKEARRLASKTHQRKLANAIFSGVTDYFDVNATEGTWVYWAQRQSRHVSAKTYKIKSGDTLSEVALRHAVPLAKLLRYNGIKGDKIKAGQVLKIPPRT